MKICMIVEDYPPNGGGGGIFVKELSERLNRKYKLTIITRGKEDIKENENGLEIIRFNGNRISFFLKSLKYLISKPAFDLYHAHGVFCGLIARKIKLIKKRPIILHIHGYRNREVNGFVKYNIQNSLVKLDYDKIISVDDSSAKKIIELGVSKEKISVIPCGVDIKKFRSARNKIKRKCKVFLFVGRLEHVKNVGLLLEALKQLKNEKLTYDLWIVGTGSLEKELKEYCKINKLNNVKFFGEILHEKLPGIYQKADFFILPSKSEGHPLTLLEGMACGLPLIVSDILNLREIINKSKSGLIFKNGNLEDLKKEMKKLISANKKEIDILKKNGRKYVENNFSWENTEEKIEKIYEQTIIGFLNSNHKE